MRKDVKDFVRMLTKRGWYVKRHAGSGHMVLFYRPGGSITVPMTPSDHRWKLNSQADARKVEEKYGPYRQSKTEHNYHPKSLTYQKIQSTHITTILPIPVIPIIPPENKVIEIQPAIQTQQKGPIMSDQDRKIIISALEEKLSSLKIKITPYLELFTEYQRVEKLLTSMKKEDQSDKQILESEKVAAFLENKGVTKVKSRIDNEDLYNTIVEIVISHNGKMNLQDLYEWLRDVKGYEFGHNYGRFVTSPLSDIVKRISYYNKTNPVRLTLGPDKQQGKARVKNYEYVMYVGAQRAAM